MLNFDGTTAIDKSLGGGLARGLARSKTVFDSRYGVSVLEDAEEGSRGGRKGFIGGPNGAPCIKSHDYRGWGLVASVRSPVWSRRGRRRALPSGSPMSVREKEGPVVSGGRERGGRARLANWAAHWAKAMGE